MRNYFICWSYNYRSSRCIMLSTLQEEIAGLWGDLFCSQKWSLLPKDQDFGRREAGKAWRHHLQGNTGMKTPSDAGGCCGCRSAHAPPFLSLSPSMRASSEDGKDGFPSDAPWEGRSSITWAPRHSARLTAVQQNPPTREDGGQSIVRATNDHHQQTAETTNSSSLLLNNHPLRCVCARWWLPASYGKKRAIVGAIPTTWSSRSSLLGNLLSFHNMQQT